MTNTTYDKTNYKFMKPLISTDYKAITNLKRGLYSFTLSPKLLIP